MTFIKKLAEKDSTRKKKKDTKKTEDGIVRRLAKNGLIDRVTVKAAKKSSSKKKKGSSSSSFPHSDSFSPSTDSKRHLGQLLELWQEESIDEEEEV